MTLYELITRLQEDQAEGKGSYEVFDYEGDVAIECGIAITDHVRKKVFLL